MLHYTDILRSRMTDIFGVLNIRLPENYPIDYTYQHRNGKSVIDDIQHSKTGTVYFSV